MKKEIATSLVSIIVVIAVGVCCLCLYRHIRKVTYNDYFLILGINDFSMQYFEEKRLRNSSDNIIDLDSNKLKINEDGYDIFLRKNYNDTAKYQYSFMRIEVYDAKHKFEHNRIAVGTEKGLVEKVYKNYEKVKDLPANQIGYIIDSLWVCFEFDNDNIVDKIILYFGP